MTKKFLTCTFAVAACLFFAGSVNANVIAIGSSSALDIFAAGPTGPQQGSTLSGTLSGSFTSPYTESVFQDGGSLNPLCPTCLDFVINLTNSAGDSIHRITVGNFGNAAVTTDVGYLLGSGGLVPDSADRTASGSGSVVGFNYPLTDPTGGLPNGNSTPELIIVTNALRFSNGTISAIDGVSANGPGYAPGVPEPSMVSFLFLGSAGLLAFARRFKKSA
jgi:hypothetical protein